VTAPVSGRLPDFPWDRLVEHRERAAAHPDGIVDLSIGTPVDPTPAVVQEALRAAADSPGYPLTIGIPAVRQAAVDWLARRHGVTGLGLDGVLPVVGTKELVASLPMQLGLGPDDTVVIPELAYPTYAVGAALVGARTAVTDSLTRLGPERPALLWLNSPSNPTGRVLPVAHLRKVVDWCRERGALLVSDECYLECAWDTEPVSVLHPEINGGSLEGILTVHSLSKRSNLAGLRVGFYAGDGELVAYLQEVRKHVGLLVPGPAQAAGVVALDDDGHVGEQRQRYRERLELLAGALSKWAGLDIDLPSGGFYLWFPAGDGWEFTERLARAGGALVSPGEFYGTEGADHVRVAVVQPLDRLNLVVERLGVT